MAADESPRHSQPRGRAGRRGRGGPAQEEAAAGGAERAGRADRRGHPGRPGPPGTPVRAQADLICSTMMETFPPDFVSVRFCDV